jgi:myo-inositol-1(or 4)-monophosphatase
VNTDGEERRVGETQTELLELAVEAARMAGGLLLERVRAGDERSVTSKSTPTDLVSEADLASERAIKQLLAERRPQDGFVGEEGGSEDGTSGLEWVVDPLDGTVNFLFGIPQWCVSVAVRDRAGSTLAGAVYDPNRGELFTATRDGKAWLSGGGAVDRDSGALAAGAAGSVSRAGECEEDVIELRGTRRAELATAMVATGLAYDARVRAAQASVLARAIPRVRDIRRMGSAALDLCWTAAGRFDAYFERTVKPWDIAAGALICERAGLSVIDLPEHEHLPYGILAAPPAIAEPLLELVGGPA